CSLPALRRVDFDASRVAVEARQCCRLFFLQCCGDPRVPHSFPTRRSSDLPTPSAGVRHVKDPGSKAACAPARIANSPTETRGFRSEEHTSELQSRGQLVCRLLLEKKNATAPRARLSVAWYGGGTRRNAAAT